MNGLKNETERTGGMQPRYTLFHYLVQPDDEKEEKLSWCLCKQAHLSGVAIRSQRCADDMVRIVIRGPFRNCITFQTALRRLEKTGHVKGVCCTDREDQQKQFQLYFDKEFESFEPRDTEDTSPPLLGSVDARRAPMKKEEELVFDDSTSKEESGTGTILRELQYEIEALRERTAQYEQEIATYTALIAKHNAEISKLTASADTMNLTLLQHRDNTTPVAVPIPRGTSSHDSTSREPLVSNA